VIEDKAASDEDLKNFVERVLEAGEVWGLQSPAGWAICESNEYEETAVLVFWSDKELAAAHAVDEWEFYAPSSIALDEFIENWLPGMHEDEALVGPDWDSDLDGIEVEPLDLARRLAE
jgi:hypothetical protein